MFPHLSKPTVTALLSVCAVFTVFMTPVLPQDQPLVEPVMVDPANVADPILDDFSYQPDPAPTNALMSSNQGLGSFPLDGGYPAPTSIFIYETPDGAHRFVFDGRLFLDAAFYAQNENQLASGAEVRDARMGVKARLWYDWLAELDVNLSDDVVELRDAWIGYAALPSTLIRVGNFKEPFSLEELMSKRNLTFIERALPNVFVPGRHLGAGINHWGSWWQMGAGFFGQEAGDTDNGEAQGYGASARFSAAPILQEDRLIHLGFALAWRTPNADVDEPDRIRFRARPETDVSRIRFLDTGQIRDVDGYLLLGAEYAATFRSLSFQGEYIQTQVERLRGRPNLSFQGSYVQVSWLLTGETRTYNAQSGEFGQVVPLYDSGAWELAARYSLVELNDPRGNVTGGREGIVTLGVNWYVNLNVRIMTNVALVNNDRFADANGDAIGGDDFEFVQTRFQVTF